MYLARVPDKTMGWRYIIRQSYAHGDGYRSRDLFDLGGDPSRFIVYPGGNGFYIDTSVEQAIADQGVSVSQDDLEPVFLPFLAPHIRRVIDGFDRKSRHRADSRECTPVAAHHRFDRYRLHFLRTGRVSQREMGCTPARFYTKLDGKSRDEIEHDFIRAERQLKPRELALYTYQIFDLQRHFTETFARTHPEALDPGRLDRCFVKTLCDLNRDRSFWMEETTGERLQPHLVRYAIMYFDSSFPLHDPFGAFLRDFMNRHRIYQPPKSVRVNLEESARLFGVPSETLKKMDCRTLTRTYRKVAQKHHPDKGGDPERFIRLNAAYQKLLKRKSKQ